MPTTTCNHDNCRFDIYDDGLCSLHYPKGDYSEDRIKRGLLRSFYDNLILYLVDETITNPNGKGVITSDDLEDYFKGINNEEKVSLFVDDVTVCLSDIHFPSRDSRDNYDYQPSLARLGAIHFQFCNFNVHTLELGDTKCFYQDCQFKNRWSIFNSPMLGNCSDVLYLGCTFHGSVSSYSPDNQEKYTIDEQLFDDCKFIKEALFESVIFKKPMFNNSDGDHGNIRKLHLLNCEIEDKFVLNNCDLEYFYSEDSLFKSKFEFKSNVLKAFEISNTNFSKVVDTYKTKFTQFEIRKSIFEDFVGFEKCEFGEKNSNDEKLLTNFTYATFLSFVNFRNTKFHSGLDIENINLKESPNFLKTHISTQNSNRETFRIVKDSFDKTGNYIEANKFFALEMSKYENELSWKENWQELLIYKINNFISNYGQSYVRPSVILIFISILYYSFTLGHDANTLYQLFPSFNHSISSFSNCVNGWASNFIPFSRLLREGMEFISLIFYILNASLIWQIAVAIKRHTKR